MNNFKNFKVDVKELRQRAAARGNLELSSNEVFSKEGISEGFQKLLNALNASANITGFNEKCLTNFMNADFQQETGIHDAILASSILQIAFSTAIEEKLPSDVVEEFKKCLLKNKTGDSPADNFTGWLKEDEHLKKLKYMGIVDQSLEVEKFRDLLEDLETRMESGI